MDGTGKTLIKLLMNFRATKFRDKVYGLYGLATDSGSGWNIYIYIYIKYFENEISRGLPPSKKSRRRRDTAPLVPSCLLDALLGHSAMQ
jgi:hypothetical protein